VQALPLTAANGLAPRWLLFPAFRRAGELQTYGGIIWCKITWVIRPLIFPARFQPVGNGFDRATGGLSVLVAFFPLVRLSRLISLFFQIRLYIQAPWIGPTHEAQSPFLPRARRFSLQNCIAIAALHHIPGMLYAV
jgi:hypothetical protein